MPLCLIRPLYILRGCSKSSLKPSLFLAKRPQLSQPMFIGEGPGLSWAVNARPGHSTLDRVSLEHSRGRKSPALACWPHFLWCNSGYGWFWDANTSCHFMSNFSSTIIPKSPSSGLLFIHSAPVCIDIGDWLPWTWTRHRTLYFTSSNFMRFTRAHLSSLSR